PWSSRSELLAGDNAFVEPAMDSRGGDAERVGCSPDVNQFAVRCGRWPFENMNVVTTAESANVTSGETMTIGGPALLAIENASDDSVGVMSRQTTYQRHGILGGAYRRRAAGWQVSIDFAESATAPAQGEMGATTFLVDGDDNFLKDRSKQFL